MRPYVDLSKLLIQIPNTSTANVLNFLNILKMIEKYVQKLSVAKNCGLDSTSSKVLMSGISQLEYNKSVTYLLIRAIVGVINIK
jgi:hypothetical protein